MTSRGSKLGRRDTLLAALALTACGATPRTPDVAAIYRYADRIERGRRRPIVTIPGLLGSRLREGGNGPFAWGGPRRLSLDPGDPDGLRRLALPVGDGTVPLSALRDDLQPDGVLRRANALVLFATLQEQVYEGLVTTLQAGGYDFNLNGAPETGGADPGAFEFAYDWRRDLVEAAQSLDAFVARRREEVRDARAARTGRRPEAADVPFDFIAHSFGALVLRWWLMYGAQDLPEGGGLPVLDWRGARQTACAIFVAPPNLGSVTAFGSLVSGRALGFLQPTYPPALLGTYPSLYQLMPRDRHRRVRLGSPDGPASGSLYDVETWAENGWGLLDPGQGRHLQALMPRAARADRESRARSHLAMCLDRAERVHAALDRPGAPDGADLFLVVGTGLDTAATVVLDRETRRPVSTVQEGGDGVVLRASATSDERQNGHDGPYRPIPYRTVLLLPGEHVDLTRNPVFADNVLHWLLGAPRSVARSEPAPKPQEVEPDR